jgi:hypothetical protein
MRLHDRIMMVKSSCFGHIERELIQSLFSRKKPEQLHIQSLLLTPLLYQILFEEKQ